MSAFGVTSSFIRLSRPLLLSTLGRPVFIRLSRPLVRLDGRFSLDSSREGNGTSAPTQSQRNYDPYSAPRGARPNGAPRRLACTIRTRNFHSKWVELFTRNFHSKFPRGAPVGGGAPSHGGLPWVVVVVVVESSVVVVVLPTGGSRGWGCSWWLNRRWWPESAAALRHVVVESSVVARVRGSTAARTRKRLG